MSWFVEYNDTTSLYRTIVRPGILTEERSYDADSPNSFNYPRALWRYAIYATRLFVRIHRHDSEEASIAIYEQNCRKLALILSLVEHVKDKFRKHRRFQVYGYVRSKLFDSSGKFVGFDASEDNEVFQIDNTTLEGAISEFIEHERLIEKAESTIETYLIDGLFDEALTQHLIEKEREHMNANDYDAFKAYYVADIIEYQQNMKRVLEEENATLMKLLEALTIPAKLKTQDPVVAKYMATEKETSEIDEPLIRDDSLWSVNGKDPPLSPLNYQSQVGYDLSDFRSPSKWITHKQLERESRSKRSKRRPEVKTKQSLSSMKIVDDISPYEGPPCTLSLELTQPTENIVILPHKSLELLKPIQFVEKEKIRRAEEKKNRNYIILNKAEKLVRKFTDPNYDFLSSNVFDDASLTNNSTFLLDESEVDRSQKSALLKANHAIIKARMETYSGNMEIAKAKPLKPLEHSLYASPFARPYLEPTLRDAKKEFKV